MRPRSSIRRSSVCWWEGCGVRARESDLPFGIVLGDEAHPAIRRIFELTGLHDVFPIYPTRALAQAGLSGDGGPS